MQNMFPFFSVYSILLPELYYYKAFLVNKEYRCLNGHQSAFTPSLHECLYVRLDLKLVEWEELGEGKEGVKALQ